MPIRHTRPRNDSPQGRRCAVRWGIGATYVLTGLERAMGFEPTTLGLGSRASCLERRQDAASRPYF